MAIPNYRRKSKIGMVYTPPQERRKGYAANLIDHMMNRLLADGRVSLIYQCHFQRNAPFFLIKKEHFFTLPASLDQPIRNILVI